MEIEIDSKKNNPLFDRTEVHFTIIHKGEGTPDRELIRGELAGKLNVKKDNIVVDNIHSGFGIQESKGYAKIYKSVEVAKDFDRDHLLERNKIIERKDKKKEEKKPAEAKPEAKPEVEAKLEGEKPEGEPESTEESPKEEQPSEEPSEKEEGEPDKDEETPKEEIPSKEEKPADSPVEEKDKTEKPEEKPAEEKKEK